MPGTAGHGEGGPGAKSPMETCDPAQGVDTPVPGMSRELGLLFAGLGALVQPNSLLPWCSGINHLVGMGQKAHACAHAHTHARAEVLKKLTYLA